jgi:hypothetical protein
VILLTPHIVQEPGTYSERLGERQRKLLDPFDQGQDAVKGATEPLPGRKLP